MKTYFIRMFNYDKFVNEFMLKTTIEAGVPDRPVKIMAHLLAVQEIWFNRCNGITTNQEIFWPELEVADSAAMIKTLHGKWLNYLNGLEPTDFEKNIGYANSKGARFENSLVDILTQVINHGTHHRAQIGQHLKSAGIDPLPNTDYISYIRYVSKS